jgi:nitrogenase molybdenum-cofactor synthesis protein NifE
MVAGVKERFLAYKVGVAFCDFNHDRVVEFEGFEGFLNFAREMDSSINSPVWKATKSNISDSFNSKRISSKGSKAESIPVTHIENIHEHVAITRGMEA